MAKSHRTPPMKDRWRADEDARNRQENRSREKDRNERRPRSPPQPRRAQVEDNRRSRESGATDSYVPGRQRDGSRDSKRSHPRRASPSPRRPQNQRRGSPQNSRALADRITRPRDGSPVHPSKRRRTHSPSPARSDRYIPDRRRDSRSRERFENRDRRPIGIDRAFSPRRSSPTRISRPVSRGEPPVIDSYIPAHRRRENSPPARQPDRRSRSPRRRSRTPPPRREQLKQSSPPPQSALPHRELSPYSARVLRTQQQNLPPQHSTPRKQNHQANKQKPARKQSIEADHNRDVSDRETEDYESMDGRHGPQQNYSTPNQMHNRPQRPFVNTQQSYGGSPPPFQTPNSSHHGSPQSGSPFRGRGGWNGPQSQGQHG